MSVLTMMTFTKSFQNLVDKANFIQTISYPNQWFLYLVWPIVGIHVWEPDTFTGLEVEKQSLSSNDNFGVFKAIQNSKSL